MNSNTQQDTPTSTNFYPITSEFGARVGDGTLNSATPAFNINSGAEPINRTWEGFIFLIPGNHTLQIGADDNASIYLLSNPSVSASKLPMGPQGGGTFAYSPVATAHIQEAGYYKVLINYTNIDYQGPVPNAAHLDVLINGVPILLGDVAPPCDSENMWITSNLPLWKTIEWFEVRNNNAGVPSVVDRGIISEITPDQFKEMACILFAEQSSFNVSEHLAIAAVMMNSWGRGKHGTLDNRTINKTITDDMGDRNRWASIGSPQYNKAKNGQLVGEEKQSLCKIAALLKQALASGPLYTYDRQVSEPRQDPSIYVVIGEHSFFRQQQYRNCGRPEWYTEP